jgi:hypothetical protein
VVIIIPKSLLSHLNSFLVIALLLYMSNVTQCDHEVVVTRPQLLFLQPDQVGILLEGGLIVLQTILADISQPIECGTMETRVA